MKYITLILFCTIQAYAADRLHYVAFSVSGNKMLLSPMIISYSGPTEIGLFGVGWHERYVVEDGNRRFALDDKGKLTERKKIDNSIYPNGAISFALGTDGQKLKKTDIKFPMPIDLPTDKEIGILPNMVRGDYRKSYEMLNVAEYYIIPTNTVDFLAFDHFKVKELVVGIVKGKVIILIIKSDTRNLNFLQIVNSAQHVDTPESTTGADSVPLKPSPPNR